MKIEISRKVLADALSELAPLASKKTVLMILSNVKFVTKGNKIRLQTSDAETSIRKYVDAENIDQDGSFLVDCASLTTFVNKVKGDNLTLTLDENTLTVKHAKGKATFQTLPPDDFPEVKQGEEAVTISLMTSDLLKLISVARSFVSYDDFRPMMKAIRAIVADGKLTVCATDTRVLFTDSIDLLQPTPDVAWYIEQSVFSMLVNACKRDEDVTVIISPSNVTYRIGATTFYTQQTQGKYPDFNRVIPKSHKVEVKCDKNDLADTLSRSTLFVEDSSLIRVAIGSAEMEISADNVSKLQKMTERVTCESDAELTIGANAKMLAGCVKACAANEVLFELEDASRPIVIKDALNPNRVILCMPMQLVNPQ